jgi:hypothetical protein
VGTPNSQKRSPRSSAKSKQDTSRTPEAGRPQSRPLQDLDEEEKYLDRAIDQVARVRAAKEAAQREMESFGDVSEYDITIIQGQLREEPVTASQSSLAFQGGAPSDTEEGA